MCKLIRYCELFFLCGVYYLYARCIIFYIHTYKYIYVINTGVNDKKCVVYKRKEEKKNEKN